jgi:hypothetical protein
VNLLDQMVGQVEDLHKVESAMLAFQTLHLLAERDYKFKEVHLRIVGMMIYDVLIEVDQNAFISDDFLQIYEAVWGLEHAARTKNFFPTVNFISVNIEGTNQINYQALIGDGYIYRLQLQHPSAA